MSTPQTEQWLRQQYRWMRLGWPLGILTGGLATTLALSWKLHPSWTKIERWQHLPAWWAGGVGLTVIAAFVVWLVRSHSLARTAQKLDATLNAKNRIETAAALRHDTSPIARVQREETDGFLSHTPVRPHRWPLFLLAAAIFLLLLGHFVTLVCWTRPWVRPVVVAPKTPPPAALPKASITWKTPEAETKASPIEEVPLQAVADSATGLRDLVLEMEVNGEPKLKVPVGIPELSKKGSHAIDASIYLDQLEVQPFDIVSYHLRAQRIDPRALPTTNSPVQFIQVKPFREDIAEIPGGDGNSGQALIAALKVAQLRLIKENFLLGHTDLGHENPGWRKENTRVGTDQAALDTKTGEVIQQLIELGAPAEIVHLITQTRPFMADAAKKITATQNQPAQVPQGKALGLITEVEKFFVKVVAKGRGKPPKGPEDPFKRQQELELKQRFETKAGELDLLVKEQIRLAGDLSQVDAEPTPAATPEAKKNPNTIDGTFPERETQISQRVGALLNGKVFTAEIVGHLTQGRDAAMNALRMLDAADVPAAREPAALTARELKLALEAMNRQGQEEAKKQLAEAMKNLNDAAYDARSAAGQKSQESAQEKVDQAAKKAAETRAALAEAAARQQETGSAEAAARMMELAKALNDKDLQKALDELRKHPRDEAPGQTAATRLDALAERAAKTRAPGPLSPEQLAKLIQQMERTQANMQRLAENGLKPNSDQPGTGKDSEGQGQGSEGQGKGSEGQGQGQGGGGNGGSASTTQLDEFADQLMNELQQESLAVEDEVPQGSALHAAIKTAPRDITSGFGRFQKVYPIIETPLQGAIALLRAHLQTMQRQYQLTTADPALAPAAYRGAVADYFEWLSRDYSATPIPTEATPTPTP
ncbi:MAG: hypothetical protein ABIT76_15390 [Chthoniobacterales bacterium]